MRVKRPRNQRRPGVRVALGVRDEALVRGLARFRAAATSQLARLYFAGIRKDTVTARLRKLFDGQILDVVASGIGAENVYSLGPGVRRWLEDRGVACGHAPRSPIEHHLAIVEVWTRLAAALHSRSDVRLVRFAPDWEYRSASAGTPAAVVPDATIDLAVHRAGQPMLAVRVFVEVDLGTERHGALSRKLETYAADRFVVGAGLAVVLGTGGRRRTGAIARMVTELWPGWSLVCCVDEWPEPLLGAGLLHAVGPLSGSPHGEGIGDGPTSRPAASSVSRGDPLSRLVSPSDGEKDPHA